MASEETRSADDIEQLRSHKERLELKAHISALKAPWWRKTGLVATMTAILAAVLPVKTAIEESFRNDRELALQRAKQREDLALQQAKQEHEIRMAYLDRFEVPGHRLQTLRFLIATTTDERLLAWAKEEKKLVEDQLAAIEQELGALARRIAEASTGQEREELQSAWNKLNEVKGATTLRPETAASSKQRPERGTK
jgi:hypothetical protein